MKRFKIAVDMDGVIADLTARWLEFYNADYDDDITHEDIKSWDTHMWVKEACGRKMYDYLAYPGIFLFAPLEKDAKECFEELCENHDVRIVTATPKISATGYREKRLWMRYNFPKFDLDKGFFSTQNKSEVKADILIDDGTHNLKNFDGFTLCFGQPWNIKDDPSFYDIYVTGWKHTLYVIDRLASDEEFRYYYQMKRKKSDV